MVVIIFTMTVFFFILFSFLFIANEMRETELCRNKKKKQTERVLYAIIFVEIKPSSKHTGPRMQCTYTFFSSFFFFVCYEVNLYQLYAISNPKLPDTTKYINVYAEPVNSAAH